MPIRWVFLDRDGTINVKAAAGEYVTAVSQVELLPGAARAIGVLNQAEVWVGIVTNQRCIARGELTAAGLEAIHRRLLEELARQGARVDGIYHCPHEPGCDCRKPEPGLLLRAGSELPGLRFAAAAMIGDSASDVQAGQRVGASTVLLADPGTATQLTAGGGADHVAGSLLEAVEWLREERGLAQGLGQR